MIKYLKPAMICLTAVFILCGALLLIPSCEDADILTQYEAAETDAPSHPDELLAGERININTADRETLMYLPGIGGALADRIIEYRSKNGAFNSVDELLAVSGIGEKMLDKLRDCVITEETA